MLPAPRRTTTDARTRMAAAQNTRTRNNDIANTANANTNTRNTSGREDTWFSALDNRAAVDAQFQQYIATRFDGLLEADEITFLQGSGEMREIVTATWHHIDETTRIAEEAAAAAIREAIDAQIADAAQADKLSETDLDRLADLYLAGADEATDEFGFNDGAATVKRSESTRKSTSRRQRRAA